MESITPESIVRFWSRVDRSRGAHSCWEWTGARRGDGYGHVSINGRDHGAHRVAFTIANGHWPIGVVRHKCDNPRCVNPEHLEEGTQSQNVADCINRGRRKENHGSLNGRAKLTQDDVDAIRRAYQVPGATVRSVAPLFGITSSQVWRIVSGQAWRCDS